MDAVTQPGPVAPSPVRTGGEVFWWVDDQGRIGAGVARKSMPDGMLGSGRVCPTLGVGVVEAIDGRGAVLGLLPRWVIDLLDRRFPGVRWAVSDPGSVSLGDRHA